MNETRINEIVYSKGVIEFLTVANEYCLFTDKVGQYPKEEIIPYYLKIAPLLYLKGILLPVIDENESEITERFVTVEAWESVYQELKGKMKEHDSFMRISEDPGDEKKISECSISEHLADIYQDLKDFIMLYQKNTHAAKENAVADCRRLFQDHWGFRIIEVQIALHTIMFPSHTDEQSENIQF